MNEENINFEREVIKFKESIKDKTLEEMNEIKIRYPYMNKYFEQYGINLTHRQIINIIKEEYGVEVVRKHINNKQLYVFAKDKLSNFKNWLELHMEEYPIKRINWIKLNEGLMKHFNNIENINFEMEHEEIINTIKQVYNRDLIRKYDIPYNDWVYVFEQNIDRFKRWLIEHKDEFTLEEINRNLNDDNLTEYFNQSKQTFIWDLNDVSTKELEKVIRGVYNVLLVWKNVDGCWKKLFEKKFSNFKFFRENSTTMIGIKDKQKDPFEQWLEENKEKYPIEWLNEMKMDRTLFDYFGQFCYNYTSISINGIITRVYDTKLVFKVIDGVKYSIFEENTNKEEK